MKSEVKLPDPELISIAAAGAMMGCSRPVVYQRIHRGEIQAFQVGDRLRLCPASIRQFMRAKPVTPKQSDQAA